MIRNRSRARAQSLALVLIGSAALAACATPQPKFAAKHPVTGPTPGQMPTGAGGKYKVGSPYQVAGVWYSPKEEPGYDQQGLATWYGAEHHLKPTANGEIFDKYALSAAHTTLPLPSIVEVTNLENGKSVQVRVNDRGPFHDGGLIDLSQAAAQQLGFEQQGRTNVRVRYVGPAPLGAPDAGLRYAGYTPSMPTDQMPSGPTPYVGLNPSPGTAPLPPAGGSSALPPLNATTPVVAPSSGTGLAYRVQAGAFADPANAQRVVNQLGGGVTATVEPYQRADGVTLYRVMVQGTPDEAEAWALRDRVAASGFAEARVVRPGL